jgi:drug/metabolite transporter (DMT)-like permease
LPRAKPAVAGVALWKEKVGIRSWLGIALAVVALVVIQLGKTAGTWLDAPEAATNLKTSGRFATDAPLTFAM